MPLTVPVSTRLLLLTFSSLILSSAAPANADVLFSSLPFDTHSGVAIVGPSNPSADYFEVAAQFTPTETATLDSIQVPLFHGSGRNEAVTVSLETSVGTAPAFVPGLALAGRTLPANTLTNIGVLYTFQFGGTLLLRAGTSYFVDVSTVGSAADGWDTAPYNSTISIPSAYRDSHGLGYGTSDVAFQVNGTQVTAVPEPGNVALLLGLTVTGTGFLSRRKRRRITA